MRMNSIKRNWKRIIGFLIATPLFFFLVFLLLNLIFPFRVEVEYSAIILDRNDEVVHAFLTSDDKWRMYTELDEISPELKAAILHKEDKYFDYHFGINPIAISRALWNNIVKGERTSGASTISMQVARMLEPAPRTYGNKMKEMFRAMQLEWMYSKEEIFQLYLNLVPYGGNIEGVKSASILYFGKDPDHLSLAEITALSIVPNRPGTWNLAGDHTELLNGRDKWLERFRADEVFSPQAIDDALSEPLNAYRREGPKEIPHLAYRLFQRYPGEYIINTWIDMEIQSQVESLVYQYAQDLSYKGIQNAAVMVIDNRTHEVIAYVGSADFANKKDGGQVDGVRAIRQPGSTLKPFLYATAIDRGLITPKSILIDAPVNFKGYRPENFDEQYRGYVSVEFSLSQSLNVPAVKLLNDMGLEPFLGILSAGGLETVEEKRDMLGLSTILGGCGVTLEEITTLYSSLANGGRLIRPLILKDSRLDSSQQLFSEQSTWMIGNILTLADRPDFPASLESSMHMPKVAWKTGTSYGRRDAWSVGYNSHYTVGVWVGNFSGEGVKELTGADMATPILFKIFNSIDYDANDEWLDRPDDLNARMICTHSGHVPGPTCASQTLDFFIPLVSSTAQCEHLVETMVSPNDSISYCQKCKPEAGYKNVWLFNHPPEIIHLYDQLAIPYQPIPPHNPDCEKLRTEGAPVIISPIADLEYLIDENYPEDIKLACQTTADVQQVHWYINDKFYTSVAKDEFLFFSPPQGTVKISCSDDQGRNSDIYIEVDYIDF